MDEVPSGPFNTAFELTGDWQRDEMGTKALAFSRIAVSLYSIELEKSAVILRDHVKSAVPKSWDPNEIASRREDGRRGRGTRVRQPLSSNVRADDLQNRVRDVADQVFGNGNVRKLEEEAAFESDHVIKFIHKRKGGSKDKRLNHGQWCPTVQFEPDVIAMSLVPISSLLTGINGSGFLSHAINNYSRYKPPIEDLHQFLEFQLPRQWAPCLGELPLGPTYLTRGGEYLRFGFMGSKLRVNTSMVHTSKRPVTGLRLYLEGRKCDILALHLQHLTSHPAGFRFEDIQGSESVSKPSTNTRYYEKFQSGFFSHVCTAPVEADDDLGICTGAHFEVGWSGLTKVLFLRVHFSKVTSGVALRKIEWDVSQALEEAGTSVSWISTYFSTAKKHRSKPDKVALDSAVCRDSLPSPRKPKLQKYVDMTEMVRGPQDRPGYWIVSGARLVVANGKIALMVKYSLLDMLRES